MNTKDGYAKKSLSSINILLADGSNSVFENNNSTAATVLEQYRPQTSYIFWHITQTQAALSRTNATWVISEPLVDTKYEYKNTSPYFQIKFYNGEYSYMTSLRNTGKNKYKWMKWTYGSFTKSFMREIAKDNGDVAILYFVLPYLSV